MKIFDADGKLVYVTTDGQPMPGIPADFGIHLAYGLLVVDIILVLFIIWIWYQARLQNRNSRLF